MAISDIETYKKAIIDQLQKAGAKGMTKSGLKVNSKLKQQAINELEKEQKIANLGSSKLTLYVLKEFDKPLDIAFEIIEKEVASAELTLFSKTKLVEALNKKCKAAKVRAMAAKAINSLVDEKKLIKLKYGRYYLFVHISGFQSYFPVIKSEGKPVVEIDRQQALKAYDQLKRQTGFSNIEIYQLQQALGVTMNILKEFLLNESRKGNAILSLGDWSLSSEQTRSGAIEINGKPHLLVRFGY